jgi:hypothetical protein
MILADLARNGLRDDAPVSLGAGASPCPDPRRRGSLPFPLRPGVPVAARCRICQRRMCGTFRTSSNGITYVYYRCPHDAANPRHAAAHPDHGPVSVSELAIMTALAQFFDQYVFGPDRAAQLPATAAGHAEAQARQVTHLRTELAASTPPSAASSAN